MQTIILWTVFILSLTTIVHGGGPPPLLTSPLLLNTKGDFIELHDGQYVRASSVSSIEGVISIEYEIDGKKAGPQSFPLSAESLSKIPTIDHVAKSSGEKITNIVARMEIIVNGKSYEIFSTGSNSPFADFERFGKSVTAGREHLEKLLQKVNDFE